MMAAFLTPIWSSITPTWLTTPLSLTVFCITLTQQTELQSPSALSPRLSIPLLLLSTASLRTLTATSSSLISHTAAATEITPSLMLPRKMPTATISQVPSMLQTDPSHLQTLRPKTLQCSPSMRRIPTAWLPRPVLTLFHQLLTTLILCCQTLLTQQTTEH